MKVNLTSIKKFLYPSLLLILSISTNTVANDIKWEFGAGLATISIPHYLGSDEELNKVLPLPYGTYEDKKTKIDRNGFNYNLFGIRNLDLSFSIGIGLPVSSEDNKARAGMKDLKTLIEIGPAIKYWLIKDKLNRLSLELPIRTAFGFDDFSVNQQGITGGFDIKYVHNFSQWKFYSSYSINYGDQKYHTQFYEVAPQYVTANRNLYQAKKGISSHSFSLAVSKRWDQFYFGIFARAEDLKNAANIDSPLVKKEDNLYASIYFGWVFASSEY
ncbi:MipA/OmpV family protein [Aliikangiella sp. IMCC44359]|uniref:MipA/OmpV family protein n=1 Tax=Aliikangiella sp. IMCC44359 TaxID=3459125 RepID=UPI00403ACD53